MRAEELMIGDWVYRKRSYDNKLIPCQIIGINRNGCTVEFDNGSSWSGECIEDIVPIPLTPEILVKNGFRYYDNCYWEKYRIIKDLTLFFELEHCDDDRHYYWESCKIQYVHELQHALKLCEIDKEITDVKFENE